MWKLGVCREDDLGNPGGGVGFLFQGGRNDGLSLQTAGEMHASSAPREERKEEGVPP
jgi:hypothetical protein